MKWDFKLFYKIARWLSIFGIAAFISEFGFSQTDLSQKFLDAFYFVVLGIGVFATFTRYLTLSSFLCPVFYSSLFSTLHAFNEGSG